MITQKDIHNHLVNNTEPLQKSYIAMQCGNDVEKNKANGTRNCRFG